LHDRRIAVAGDALRDDLTERTAHDHVTVVRHPVVVVVEPDDGKPTTSTGMTSRERIFG
jgi:hypothetical protein